MPCGGWRIQKVWCDASGRSAWWDYLIREMVPISRTVRGGAKIRYGICPPTAALENADLRVRLRLKCKPASDVSDEEKKTQSVYRMSLQVGRLPAEEPAKVEAPSKASGAGIDSILDHSNHTLFWYYRASNSRY